MRAMRGQTLRVEVYGLDGADNDGVPVQVAETRVRVVQKQAPWGGRGAWLHGVMFVHGEEAVTVHYEKNEFDPRVAHTLTLEMDDYGVATREATVVYGRKVPTPYPGATEHARGGGDAPGRPLRRRWIWWIWGQEAVELAKSPIGWRYRSLNRRTS
ncbi:MAG: toxin TcdB middle/C-terminal domain-containing protein [Polyangiaceae bacterium]